MKSKDRKEIFTKNEKELRKALKEARDLLFNLGLDNKQNKLKNTRQIFWKKKEIAWILTALKERELSIVKEK
jgi:ribosomal protein L29